MAQKTQYTAELNFIATGIDAVQKQIEQLKGSGNLTKLLEVDLGKLSEEVSKFVGKVSDQLSSGIIDPDKVNIGPLEKRLAKILDRVNLSFKAGEIDDSSLAAFEARLKEIDSKIIDSVEKIGKYEEALSTIETNKKTLKETTGIKATPKEAAEKLKQMESLYKQEVAKGEKASKKEKERLEKDIKNYTAYLDEMKKLLKQEASARGQITKQKSKQLTLTTEKISVSKEKEAALPDSSVMKKFETLRIQYEEAKKAYIDLYQKLGMTENIKKQEKATKDLNDIEETRTKTLTNQIATGFSYYVIFNKVRQLWTQSINTLKHLDQALTTVSMVTSMTRKEAWGLLGAYQNLAKEVGITTSEVAELSVYFFRQGRNAKDALELTKVAAQSARVAGIAAAEAADYLTTAVNGFGLAAEEAANVADKFSAIAARSASSFEELAIAMSKVAPVAQSAGVSIDFMMGVIAKGLETTREAPENIGTAFKTIFARMREITDIGKATEDGMSLNRVEKALGTVGVSLRDTSGQMRNLEDVLIEVGKKWDTLDTLQQAYLATALAGTRQQPRLLAIFNDFDRTLQLIAESQDSAGAMMSQHTEYMKGMEAATANLKTAWEELITTFANSEVMIFVINAIRTGIEGVTKVLQLMGPAGTGLVVTLTGLSAALVAAAISQKFYTKALAETAIFQGISDILSKSYIANKIKEVGLINFLTLSTLRSNVAKRVDLGMTTKQIFLERLSAASKRKIIMTLTGQTIAETASTTAKKKGILATIGSAIASGAAALWNGILTGSLWASVGAWLAVAAAELLALWPLYLIAAAIAVVVLAVVAMIKHFQKVTKSVKAYAKEIKETNSQMYKLKNQAKSLDDLKKKFDELDKKAVKTNEEIAEMNRLLDEASRVEINGKTENFTKLEYGELVFDAEKYEKVMQDIADKQEALNRKNITSLTDAITYQGIKALKNEELADVAKNIGYNYGKNLIDGIENSGVAGAVSDSLKTSLDNTNLEAFVQEVAVYRYDGNTYSSLEDAQAAKAKKEKNWGSFKKFLNKNNIVETTVETFDEGAMERYAEAQVRVLTKHYEKISAVEEEVNKEVTNGTKTRLQGQTEIIIAGQESYAEALKNIDKEAADLNLKEDEIIQLKATLALSMQAEAAVYDLIHNKGVSVDVIAKMRVKGLDINKISEIYQEAMNRAFDENNNKATGVGGGRERRLLTNLFSGENIAENIDAYKDYLNTLLGMTIDGVEYTQDVINSLLNSTIEAMNFSSASEIATEISSVREDASLLAGLESEILEGNFENYVTLAETYGPEFIDSFLNGDPDAFKNFFDSKRDDIIGAAEDSIASILGQAGLVGATVEEALASDALNDTQKNQLIQQQFMIDNYSEMSSIEQERLYRLQKASDILSDMNNFISVQNNLLKLGADTSSDFYQFLDGMIQTRFNQSIDQLEIALDRSREKLAELGNFDSSGNFIADPDASTTAVTEALDDYASTLKEYTDAMASEYERQSKIIEDRYKSEIDAIKNVHDEKWKQIDYNNKLAEQEEKILDMRRKLSSLSLDSTQAGAVENMAKDLEKLRQERQKLIEDQIVASVEKAKEEQKQEELKGLQSDTITGMKNLVGALDRNTLAQAQKIMDQATGQTGSAATSAFQNNIWSQLAILGNL